MEKLLRCKDLDRGLEACSFEACGETAEEALEIALAHARSIHGATAISAKDLARAREAIQDAFCVPKGGCYPGRGNSC